MLEHYFGLIEATFVFGLAMAFFLWQRRDLNRYKRQDEAARKQAQDKAQDKT